MSDLRGNPPLAAIQRVRSPAEERAAMAAEVRASLAAPLPWLPSKYFYDDVGSALFEEITRLPEYYQTRTEEVILAAVSAEIVATVRPRELVELGAGAGRKIRRLLDEMGARDARRACTLLDVSEGALADALRRLADAYPRLDLRGVAGDFQRDLGALGRGEDRLVAFLGSTIGNLHPEEVPAFLRSVAAAAGETGTFLLGVDLVKEVSRLEAAYNDSMGVTARFNRNILSVVNERLEGDFEPQAFDHVAFYDRDHAWIEMRLRATRPMRIRVRAAGVELQLERGGEIRTEISCKYEEASLLELAAGTGLGVASWWTDPEELFAVALLEPTRAPTAAF